MTLDELLNKSETVEVSNSLRMSNYMADGFEFLAFEKLLLQCLFLV